MTRRWFRYHTEALDNPKVQGLTDRQFKTWVNLLCIAAQYSGTFPPVPAVAFHLRCDDTEATSVLEEMKGLRLIDCLESGALAPHDWHNYQYSSDSSTERTRKHRRKLAEAKMAKLSPRTVPENVSGNVLENVSGNGSMKQNSAPRRAPLVNRVEGELSESTDSSLMNSIGNVPENVSGNGRGTFPGTDQRQRQRQSTKTSIVENSSVLEDPVNTRKERRPISRNGKKSRDESSVRTNERDPRELESFRATFPLSIEAVRRFFPATDIGFIETLVCDSFETFKRVANGAVLNVELTDKSIADAVRLSHIPDQKSAGLFLTRLPTVIEAWTEIAKKKS
jgi:hypothetical protein